MNNKKAKGLRKLAKKVITNAKQPPMGEQEMYQKMKTSYKQAKGER